MARFPLGAAARAALLCLAGADAARAAPPQLELPVVCAMGSQCVIQNYFDHDPGPGATDFACGRLTYDGHHGTDFRLPNLAAMEAGVAVRAAAAGTVLRTRDGMEDVDFRIVGTAAIADQEAGNAVVIDHGDGWTTQYNHLRKGSVLVKRGDTVAAGQQLGLIGLSGQTQFPHLDLDVRHGEQSVDPFTGEVAEPGCDKIVTPLWSAAAAAVLPYASTGLLSTGFAAEPPTQAGIDGGTYNAASLPADSPALVFWVDIFGVRTGDEQVMRLIGPDGKPIAGVNKTSPKPLAEGYSYIGAKRRGAAWPPGSYRGEYTLTRYSREGPTVLLSLQRTIELR